MEWILKQLWWHWKTKSISSTSIWSVLEVEPGFNLFPGCSVAGHLGHTQKELFGQICSKIRMRFNKLELCCVYLCEINCVNCVDDGDQSIWTWLIIQLSFFYSTLFALKQVAFVHYWLYFQERVQCSSSGSSDQNPCRFLHFWLWVCTVCTLAFFRTDELL